MSSTTAPTSASTPASATPPSEPIAAAASVEPVATQTASIRGKVEHRQGDGPNIVIRQGPVGVQLTSVDATLSWEDGETRGAAAMPIADFRRYVTQGAIKLHA